MKEWKTIPGYALYMASTDGEIKTFNHMNTGREAILKPAMDNCGYMRTMLKRDIDGKTHTIKMHRIIALTFIPNPENKPTVNHKNGVRNDNRLCNLEWATMSENVKHSFATNGHNHRGENNSCAKMTDAQVIELRSNYQYGKNCRKGTTKKQLAQKYNTSVSSIKQIISGKTWKHLL